MTNPAKHIYYTKEVMTLLQMKEAEVLFFAKYFRVAKVYGIYRFSEADIERIKEFTQTNKT